MTGRVELYMPPSEWGLATLSMCASAEVGLIRGHQDWVELSLVHMVDSSFFVYSLMQELYGLYRINVAIVWGVVCRVS